MHMASGRASSTEQDRVASPGWRSAPARTGSGFAPYEFEPQPLVGRRLCLFSEPRQSVEKPQATSCPAKPMPGIAPGLVTAWTHCAPLCGQIEGLDSPQVQGAFLGLHAFSTRCSLPGSLWSPSRPALPAPRGGQRHC